MLVAESDSDCSRLTLGIVASRAVAAAGVVRRIRACVAPTKARSSAKSVPTKSCASRLARKNRSVPDSEPEVWIIASAGLLIAPGVCCRDRKPPNWRGPNICASARGGAASAQSASANRIPRRIDSLALPPAISPFLLAIDAGSKIPQAACCMQRACGMG